MHLLDHKGEFFSVRGPLNVARSPQDMPVLVLSGASERAFDLAARSADVVLLDEAEDSKTRHDDLKRRVAASGRNPDAVKVLVNISATGSDIDPDRLEELFRANACDGFNITMSISALYGFVDRVLPELRRRGFVREGYRGTTLRSHLGLAGGDQ
jgi:alkanesulfonate monooxygenase SsuD/methylene tetrahydromethanopterin reductase-like flavin-dependent oxidoreductase (luciferase family)